jgi:ubiquinone biosynthesis protein
MAAAPHIVQLPARGATSPKPSTRYRRREPKSGETVQLSRDGWSLPRFVRGGFFRTLARLLQILGVAFYLSACAALDRILIRGLNRRIERRAVLLRHMFEILGGAFIKIGQQLSMRPDMLAAEYCEALKDLLDSVKEFDFALAKREIEKQIQAPTESVFINLDPTPIGRGSIACVYQAWLCDDRRKEPVRVAIKVRRPGIVALFAADLRALDWIAIVLEYLTVLRVGVSHTFRTQIKQILFDELDFGLEARYQELFRRRYRKHKSYGVTAPKVFYRYSGKSVLVSEFVDAIPLGSITDAVEFGDEEYLEYLRSLDIHPKELAKRLIRYNFHAFFEDTFFHGDPHPANIMVLPKNEMVFVDFGACGTFSEWDRHMMLHLHYFHSQKDILGMVQSVIALMEPLPPIDIDEFRRKLEKQYWDGYYGLLSKHADWRERTSYRIWVALFDLVREYHIPLPLNMLRMIRATLLYDTIAARLHNQIDVFKEFRKYERGVARRLRSQLIRDVCRQSIAGPDLHWYLSFHRLFNMARTAIFRLQKFLDEPGFGFQAIADKVYFAIGTVTQWLVSSVIVGFVFTLILVAQTPEAKLQDTLVQVLNPYRWGELEKSAFKTLAAYGIVLTIVALVNANALRRRFADPDR